VSTGHFFVDSEGNRHHLGSDIPKRGKRKGGKVFSLPLEEIEDGSIEAGLLCLRAFQAENPGVVLKLDEIAYVCGCSDSLIVLIEQQALKRVRKYHSKSLAEFAGRKS
jgi:hypothetical protein